MYDVHNAIAARLNPCVGLVNGLDRFERPFHSVVDDGPKFPSCHIENLWDKQARLEHDYFKSSRMAVLDDLDRGIPPQTGAALNALNSFNDSRDYPEYNTPRYGRSSGLSDDFFTPKIRHDPELLSPKLLVDRFEPSFSAPRMRHSRYEDDFEAPKTPFENVMAARKALYEQYSIHRR